jgi:hypothetical protein
MSISVLFPLHFRVQFWTDFANSAEFSPDSGDLLGGSMTVGGETLARQRLARDAGWVRFGCENWEYVGRKDKFGGGLQKNLQVECIYGAYFDTFFARLQTAGYFAVRGYLGFELL